MNGENENKIKKTKRSRDGMISFLKLAEDSYVVYKNGVRITELPLNRQELHEKILEIDMSERDVKAVDYLYGKG